MPSPSPATSGRPRLPQAVPGYLRPSPATCHHVCKYGGTHTFEDHKEAHRPQPRPPRKQQQAAAPESHSHNRVLVKVRSVFRRPSKATAGKTVKSSGVESVEWKDIVAYDTVPLPPHGSSSPQLDRTSAQFTGSGDDAKKKDVMKGKRSHGKAKIHEQVEGQALLVENMGINQEMLQGYQILSPSLLQSRASLLRDLEKEMMVHHEAADAKEGRATPTYSLDPEECAAAAESSRPIPAHRRVQSMSISSRSVRHPFASRNSGAFKLRSRSTRAPAVLPPPDEEKPARLRSRRGGENPSATTGRGIHLRIRSLRKRGVGGSGGAGTAGFVVPAVALRHQKTLEKNKSQRLYNNLIEETATRLVKTRKSRVKALVGAFETVISKIAK